MIKKVFKFGVSGASAAIVNLCFFFLLEHILNINYVLAVIISTLFAASYHFMIQKMWVFKMTQNGSTKTESYLFFVTAVINLVLNELFLVLFISALGFNPLLAQFISLGLLACMNFFVYEHIVFVKKGIIVNRIHNYLDHVNIRHVLLVLGLVVWVALHYWGVIYGTQHIPLHQSYVGDEQAPVNGALHILKDKSIFAVHNLKTLYYGPIFAVIASPAVITDFTIKYAQGDIVSAEDYKNSLLWDWGGVIAYIRLISVLAACIGIVAVFFLARTNVYNPTRNRLLPYIAVLLFTTNFYYFEYSHFFKHWIFIIVLFLLQLLCIAKILDQQDVQKRKKLWLVNACIIAFSFGISYVSLFFQIIWFTCVYFWLRNKQFDLIREWCNSILISVALMLLIFWWHPYALLRIFRGGATIPFGEEMLGFSYFSELIVLNHVGIFVALCSMIIYLLRNRLFVHVYSSVFIYGLLSIGLFQYLLFSMQPGLNREGRYMLPVIVCLLLMTIYVLGIFFSAPRSKKLLSYIVVLMLSYSFIFHTVHIVRWVHVYSQGHVEQRMLQSLQIDTDTNDKILLVQYYIAGIPHTTNAYLDYMNRFGRSEVNLFKQLLVTVPKQDARRYDLYYIRPDQFKVTDIKHFDHVVYLNEPRHEINQFDYFDQSLVRLWWYNELSPSYHVIK